jgi:chromosome segregation ATPase
MSAAAPARPDVWSRLGRFLGRLLGFVLRLVFILLLAVGIGVGVYSGIPWVYRQLIQPVETHNSQIQDLYNRVEGVRAGTEQSQTTQNDRLTALETGNDDERLRLDAAEGALETLRAELAAAVTANETLAAEMATLRGDLTTLGDASAQVQASVDGLQPAADETAAQVESLNLELGLLRLENDLLRARVQVVAENFGEARTIMTDTVAAMTSFLATPGAFDANTQANLRVRLNAATALIEPDPAAALGDLDSIWRELERALNLD